MTTAEIKHDFILAMDQLYNILQEAQHEKARDLTEKEEDVIIARWQSVWINRYTKRFTEAVLNALDLL